MKNFLQAYPLLPILIFLAVVIAFRINVGEIHFNGDEMPHTMTGVFFRDAMVDLPIANPMRYVREYYAKYPALGIPHWPPLFYFVEGIFFLVFGISVWASRLCILCYSLLAAYFWYRIAERQGPRHLALLSALLYPLLPYMILYERSAMLEVPLLAMSFGAIFYWLRFVEAGRTRDVWLVAFYSAAAFLTSQKGMFLPVLLGLHFLVIRPFHLLKKWQVWAALAAVVAAVLPWYLLSFGTLTLSYERVVGQSFHQMAGAGRHEFTYYVDRLPDQLRMGWVIPAVAGFLWALLRQPKKNWFFLLWVVSCYGLFTLTREKDVRHTMIWIPVLVYFGLLVIDELFRLAGARRWVWAGFAVMIAYTMYKGFTIDRPRLWGLQGVARYMSQQPESDIVYYQGALSGDYIFYTRKFDPEKRHMVAREKQAVATKIVAAYGTRVVLRSPEQIVDFFRTWGIRYALVENRNDIDELNPMTQVFHSDAFELVRIFPLESTSPANRDRRIQLFRYRGPLERTNGMVTIPMMTIRNDIHARLADLVGRPWPQ